MNDSTKPLQGIIDITPPSAPWQYILEANAFSIAIAGLLTISILTLTLFILWRHFFSSKGKARQKIGKLKKHYRLRHISGKHVAFQLAQILRDALKLNQLSPRTALPSPLRHKAKRWLEFNEALSQMRYANQAETQPTITFLIDEAYFWLRHWPKYD